MKRFLITLLTIAITIMSPVAVAKELPPAIGPSDPMVQPVKGDDGLYHQAWFEESFLDLKEDFTEAKENGRRFAVIFEQRGCSYCTKMHTEVLAKKYINDYVRKNFRIVQLNLWGAREVTDFDGTVLTEKKLAERWGVLFTPTVVFLKSDVKAQKSKWGRDLEVLRMSLGVGPGTFYDIFTWVKHEIYKSDRNFQRFHLARYDERQALKKAGTGATQSQ